jgi:non-canonical poly(A) RNA polymerase PAPD5/7
MFMTRRPGAGFTEAERKQVSSALLSISRQLARRRLHNSHESLLIKTAKVPIIKTRLGRAGHGLGSTRVPADIALGVQNGAEAVEFVHRQQQALPPLRPLVLFLKSLLRGWGLNEAGSGGLSSFALTNMVRSKRALFERLHRRFWVKMSIYQ